MYSRQALYSPSVPDFCKARFRDCQNCWDLPTEAQPRPIQTDERDH